MGSLFRGAISFNQDISGWDMSGATNLSSMFFDASSFDQDIGDWDINGVSNLRSILSNSGISQYNYDQILKKWSAQNVQQGITLDAQGLVYCFSDMERDHLTTVHQWSIIDNGQDCINVQPCTTTTPNTFLGTTSEDWNTPSNWETGAVPNVCDAVIMPTGLTVTLSGNAECYSLDVAVGGDIEVADFKMEVWSL